jgi:hypothetical protein
MIDKEGQAQKLKVATLLCLTILVNETCSLPFSLIKDPTL